MKEEKPIVEKRVQKRFVLSLALANYGTGMLDVVASLFLVEIAATFLGSSSQAALGNASQIYAISSMVAIVSGVSIGVLSLRLRYKTLLLFGAACIVVGAVGCFLAPSFLFFEIFYPLDGAGTIVVGSMAIALIGENLSVGRRPKAISWVVTGGVLATAIGYPVSGFIAGIAGWRNVLLWYVLPVSVATLVLAFLSVPNRSEKTKPSISRRELLRIPKEVLLNRSSFACLVGNMFITAAGMWAFFTATFWRKQFLLSVQSVSIITVLILLVYTLGSVTITGFINRIGRKRLVVYTWTLRSLLFILIVFMPSFWSALVMSFVATFVGGFTLSSGPSLILEQAPKYRGTMMSVNGVFTSIGSTIGVAVGGLTLGLFGYQVLGVSLGVFGFVSALVVLLFAKDPCVV